MAQYRKQHLLPRLSLEHFVDTNGHVWTYDKERGGQWHRIPGETGVIAHFYSFEMEDGSLNTSFEEIFAKIESDAAPVYKKLVNDEPLIGDERFAFSYFLGAMHVRTTTMRRMVAQMRAHYYHTHLVATARHEPSFDAMIREVEGGDLDPEVKEMLRQDIENSSEYSVTFPKEQTFSVFAVGDKLAAIFLQMSWTVATPESHFFITCDNPIHLAVGPRTIPPIYGDRGFINKTAQVTFVLSPKKLLILTHTQNPAPPVVIPKEYVLKENRKRAFDADEFVYAHREDKRIARLVAAYKGKRPGISAEGFDGTKGFGEVKVSRKTRHRSP